MKFSQLKSLLQQGKLAEFQQQIQKQVLVAADYDLVLRQCIRNKVENFQKYFNFLVNKGADVNFTHMGGNKKSNLMVACEQGSLESVQLLCSHPKINFYLEDSMKKTAPFYAIQNKNKNDSQIFLYKVLKQAPNLICRAANNETMLIMGIKRQKPELVRILLSSGADPNYIITDSGNTALHQALKLCKTKQTRANRQIVKLLIQHGADPNIKNNKDKNAFQFADRFPLKALVDEIKVIKIKGQETDTKPEQEENLRNELPIINKNRKKMLVLNTQNEYNDLMKNADVFYSHQMRNSQLLSDSQSSSEQGQYQDQTDGVAPYKKSQKIFVGLTQQIGQFSKQCEDCFQNANQDFQDFYHKVCIIANKQCLDVKLYGSFSTGLWLNDCNIDMLLIPHSKFMAQKNPKFVQDTLGRFQTFLRKQPSINIKNWIKSQQAKVSMLSFEIQFPNSYGPNSRTQKVDITVLNRGHNGLAIAHYICENMKIFPQLKPLFFTIKTLTYDLKLSDTKNGGIRTYAIIIMILSFLQSLGLNPNQYTLGQLLLRFLFFFGFEYQYGYGSDQLDNHLENIDIQPKMLLTIYDPLNHLNNLGKKSKAYELQCVFKAGYIALHSNIKKRKLQFMFDLRKISIF